MKNKKTKKGFKVCHVGLDSDLNTRYTSCFNFGKTVIYKKKEWAKRPEGCGSLTVFSKLQDARKFFAGAIITKGNHSILKCKYKESMTKEIYYMICGISESTRWGPIMLPKGTMFADEVKILKEVETKE